MITTASRRRCFTSSLWRASLATAAALIAAAAHAAPGGTRVVTYHYDNLRTGWNAAERELTPSVVGSSQFKMVASTPLDDLVHAQPLVMTHQHIQGHGIHDVVYVATESNTLYAIDAATGAVLKSHNFGPPVPYTGLPNQCTNNGPNLGITSTPVILQVTGKIYLMTYTFPDFVPTYQLHQVDLATLEDAIAPVTVTASAKLSDGSTYKFDASVSRQRPALLLSNGNVYAGFGSFCDSAADRSRGWMLGFSGDDLSPLSGNELANARTRSPNMYFLSSVWMSGAGPAASLDGHVYFVTGNSDFSGTTFRRFHNIEESVVQVSDDLLDLDGLFTPDGPTDGWSALDKVDNDFGSGGVMLLPAQKGAPSNLAVALGKVGKMYLLNADDLDNHAHGDAKAYDIVDGGACWCAESYFQGPDGVGRVISSGDNVIHVWKVATGAAPKLTKEIESARIDNGQDPGVFTWVSSDGRKPGTAVIWAVGRPVDFQPGKIELYAFDAASGATLFTGDAGTWPFPDNNATVMPVVANGKVFVASYKTLAIFAASGAPARQLHAVLSPALRAPLGAGEHEIYGTVRGIQGPVVALRKRDGSMVSVDVSGAEARHAKAQPQIGKALVARGKYLSSGALAADVVLHAKSSPAMWYPDR
ncbi:MAG: PQQ-binding-like beta-propeller repeat protein [Alphaproteobacteria bacterium]|nr:PQQ-binding-like beta-propeller repeat protein [Alphaproteobacteria bacterium]